MDNLTTADRIAMYVGGGLVVLGTVIIGFLEMLLGAGHPVDSEGAIVHEALVPLEIRSYIIMLGLFVWMGYAVYKVAMADGDSRATAGSGAAAGGDD